MVYRGQIRHSASFNIDHEFLETDPMVFALRCQNPELNVEDLRIELDKFMSGNPSGILQAVIWDAEGSSPALYEWRPEPNPALLDWEYRFFGIFLDDVKDIRDVVDRQGPNRDDKLIATILKGGS